MIGPNQPWGDESPDDRRLERVAQRLTEDRPQPGAALRGQVRALLAAVDASGQLVPRPRRLWLRVAAFAIAGAVALALVAAGVAGAGPFAS
jgi:hypothetical protein